MTTVVPTRNGHQTRSPGATDPSSPRIRVLPDRRPPAACWSRPLSVPDEQAPLALGSAPFPPPAAGDAHQHRAPWFAPPPPGLPDPRAFVGSLAQAVAEVLVGRRPITQLVRWVDESCLAGVNWRARTAARERRHAVSPPPTVRSVHLQLPRPRVVEAAVHLHGEGVPAALALRLAARRQRWFCTALELGPRPQPGADDLLTPAAAPRSGRA